MRVEVKRNGEEIEMKIEDEGFLLRVGPFDTMDADDHAQTFDRAASELRQLMWEIGK